MRTDGPCPVEYTVPSALTRSKARTTAGFLGAAGLLPVVNVLWVAAAGAALVSVSLADVLSCHVQDNKTRIQS